MSWNNILVIGVGQLGSKHLQGLAKSNSKFRISVVDPSEENSNKAKKGVLDLGSLATCKEIRFYRTIDETDKILYELAIISTNSDVRFSVIKEVLNISRVKNMILEKVVFQRPHDFTSLSELLKNSDIKVWVNCPRRLYPVYIGIRQLLEKESQISMTVKGGNWGLGGNAIHFIDMFLFIVGSNEVTASEEKLDNIIHQSKRKGFLEFSGILNFKSAENSLSVCSEKDSTGPITVFIESSNFRIIVNETSRTWSVYDLLTGERNEEIPFTLPFQSDLTGEIASNIINGKEPGLVSLKSSAVQHVVLLNVLTKHLSKITDKNYSYCPVT